jgi:hypothetical protein
MFDHATIRVTDRSASERFYDAVLAPLGRVPDVPAARRFYETIAPPASRSWTAGPTTDLDAVRSE